MPDTPQAGRGRDVKSGSSGVNLNPTLSSDNIHIVPYAEGTRVNYQDKSFLGQDSDSCLQYLTCSTFRTSGHQTNMYIPSLHLPVPYPFFLPS